MDLLTGENPEDADFAGDAVHNGIMRALLYGGIFVFAGALYAYGYSLWLALKVMGDYLNGQRNWLMLGLAVSIVGWTISDLAVPSFYQRFTWITVPILYGLYLRTHPAQVRTSKVLTDSATDAAIAKHAT
jgi:hypothetical protein